ncbi:glycosyltransferase family 4 protein [Mangrovimonas sp. AS39]|uniref:glycosyltransferase family 4 protein n=1 Tax=Mangrovimonas futianensis TaxID=2895523 RepID=UPI001E440E48|nr:glycosyltransferase family 4 protein [Mangrovimonas futianensis]MCF1191229.1 glycosyltransferase family 4 protein [Mangrovimonas futianensis]MCF1194924.1 glycosyltransferase family 4 protein [Mangrovimonas futianensis]
MKTFIIPHRSPHHAANSGYDRLVSFISADQIPSKPSKIPYRVAKAISKRVDQRYGIYDSNSVFKDYELGSSLLGHPKSHWLVHYLNAERDIRFVLQAKSWFQNARFVGSFHKPPAVLKAQITSTKYVKKLDGAIAVGLNQVDFLKDWLGLDRVVYIPHGVDTGFFTPKDSPNRAPELLFVGQHLRDFEAFNYCVPLLAEKIKGLRVNVVLRPDFYHKVRPHPCVSLYSHVTDLELRNFYRQADMLFLPLLDATACNSVLEALACGLPIVTTDAGGTKAYLKGTGNIVAPLGDLDYLIEATVSVMKDFTTLQKMSESSRKASLAYDWVPLAKEIEKFYTLIRQDYQ